MSFRDVAKSDEREMNKSKSDPSVVAVPLAKEPDILVERRYLPAQLSMILSTSTLAAFTFSSWDSPC